MDEALACIASLQSKDFHKSMTTDRDHTVWQDVYYLNLATGVKVYAKFTLIGSESSRIVISFKRAET